jgi:hypothetical protein
MKITLLGMIALGGLLCTSSTMAQVPNDERSAMPCPNPTSQTLQMTAPGVVNSEFSATVLALPRAGLNDPATNKVFLGTFSWKPPACCQITGAVLTVVMRANQAGATAPTSPDSGNDTLAVWGGGTPIVGLGGTIYPNGQVTIGQQVTKTVVMNGAALAKMNANNKISFSVQDDTGVVSASLRIDRCCVNVKPY